MDWLERAVVIAGVILVFALLLFVPDWNELLNTYIEIIKLEINDG